MKAAHVPVAIAAGLAVAIFAVPAAQALSGWPQAHRPAATGPQSELHSTSAELVRATAELAGIRRRLGAGPLQRQVSQLQQTLGAAKAQLKTAQVKLDAQSPLDVAVQQVRREVAWAQQAVPYSRAQLIAQAAMDYTVGHVSTAAFGYLELVKRALPGYRPNRILAAQAGICGQASWVFAAIVRKFGLDARSVTFSYDDPDAAPDGHTAVEVSYGGSWHFFDPTYGQFWTDAGGDVLSIAQIRAGLGTNVKDLASFTNVVESAWFGNDTWFITAPGTVVQIGTLTLKSRVGR